jgi:ABC-2 type transport system ATP-binding protein
LILEVKNISKTYNNQKAVDNISFNLSAGEIVGFLGPNGAGKTTTMKMITTYLGLDKGSISICNKDISDNKIFAKTKIGYLAEENPLYYEMYIIEFLNFIASLHKLSDKKNRVDEIIKEVGLEKEKHKKIGNLSKGYKQRVGLAQAMIHKPDLLILDEPTSGLDPNQLIEIRSLIKNYGKQNTVLLSTHIMQEVESICDRVIIINEGKIVADKLVSNLRDNQNQILIVEFENKVSNKELLKINGVNSVKKNSDHSWTIISELNKDIRSEIAKFATKTNNLILSLNKKTDSLENIFKNLTN